jgi:hypothetical protein
MSSMFLVVYTSAHLIGAVSYPLPEKICEQVRDEWAKLYDDYTFACEEHRGASQGAGQHLRA